MTPPTEFNPTPEQVEEVAAMFYRLHCPLIPFRNISEYTRKKYFIIARHHLTELHRETEKLRLEGEADMRSFNEAAKFSTELIAEQKRQLDAAQSVNQDWQKRFVECVAQRDDARLQLDALKAQVVGIIQYCDGDIMYNHMDISNIKAIAVKALAQLSPK